MILVDTNILIDYYKSRNSEIANIIDSTDVAICGVVKTELLHGAINDDEIDKFIHSFSTFELKVTDEYDWEFSGLMLQTLRQNGLQVPVTDAMIAYIAIKYDIPLWTKDHHFKLIQAVYPELQLYQN